MSHYPPYAGYKDSGVQWLGNIPESWDVRPLKLLAQVALSNVDKLTVDGETPVRLCNYVDAYKNERIVATLPFMEASASSEQIRRLSLQRGDVIITKDSETPDDIGIPALVAEDMDGIVCGYHLALLRPHQAQAVGGYLQRVLQSGYVKAEFFCSALGMTRYGLSKYDIENLKLPVPPVEEQRAIVAALDRETVRIDALIAKKTEFIDLLNTKRQALMTHAVTKGLNPKAKTRNSGVEWIGEVPEHWEIRRMATLFREVARPGDQALPILSISIHDGITDDEVAPEDRDRRVTQIEDRTKYKRVAPKDLAYNMMRAWQGAFGAVTVDGLVSPAYVVAEPIDEFRTVFIEHLLRTPMAIEEMRRYSRGIADFRMRLYWDYFRDLKVCLPPLNEQDNILRSTSAETARIDLLVEKTQHSIDLLKQRRSALITAAVTGQIDLRESA